MSGTFWLDESTDVRYYEGRAFSYGDINYTKAGATPETFAGLGFVQVQIEARPDDRFYIVSGPDDTGAYNSTPRELNDTTDAEGDTVYGLKHSYKTQQLQTARQLLTGSDWYAIREFENATPVPTEWANYRASVRTTASTRWNEVDAVTTVEELEDLVKAPEEVQDPAYPDDPTARITNPDAHLTPWPEAPAE